MAASWHSDWEAGMHFTYISDTTPVLTSPITEHTHEFLKQYETSKTGHLYSHKHTIIKDVSKQIHLYCEEEQIAFLSLLHLAYFMATNRPLKFSSLLLYWGCVDCLSRTPSHKNGDTKGN